MLRISIIISAWLSFSAASPLRSSTEYANLFGRNSNIQSGCSISETASCSNTTEVSDLCCFESPGGLLLQTQFWDTSPSTGPNDSWTIHGLWPDNCDTTFSENCDPSRAYTDIASLLTVQGANDTLAFMQTHWVDINGNNEQFWEHEWETHGTCMSTLEPACLPSDSPTGAEATAFFQTVVGLFQTLPTFTWLSNAGINPSTTETFELSTLTSALMTGSGVIAALDCNGKTLDAVSYYFNLKGSIIDGAFVPIDAPKLGSCPSTGIKYPPKFITNTDGLPFRAQVHAIQESGSLLGGILSLGTWSTQTLATFTLTGSHSNFTMTSSKGTCGVTGGLFSCGSGVISTTFSAVSSGDTLLLASDGSTSFGSDGIPSGTTVFKIFTDSPHSQVYTLEIVGV